MVGSADRERYRLGIPVHHHGAIIGLRRTSEVVAIGTLILHGVALPISRHQLLLGGQTIAPLALNGAVVIRSLSSTCRHPTIEDVRTVVVRDAVANKGEVALLVVKATASGIGRPDPDSM